MANSNDKIELKLVENWDLFTKIIESKIENKQLKAPLLKLCEDQSTRIITCPASTREDYIGAFTGGLVWHSLNVLKTMKEINKICGNKASTEDMIVASLFHDIGKIGDKTHDYYYRQDSEWHRERGMFFETNKKLNTSSVSVRSLWWLNQYAVPMSIDMISSISAMQNASATNDFYSTSYLTNLLQQSVQCSCSINRGKTNILEE